MLQMSARVTWQTRELASSCEALKDEAAHEKCEDYCTYSDGMFTDCICTRSHCQLVGSTVMGPHT